MPIRKYKLEDLDRKEVAGFLTTRCPKVVWDYAMWLSRHPETPWNPKTAIAMTTWMMVDWLQTAPWVDDDAWTWPEPRAVTAGSGPTGWKQVNIQLEETSITNPRTGKSLLLTGDQLERVVRSIATGNLEFVESDDSRKASKTSRQELKTLVHDLSRDQELDISVAKFCYAALIFFTRVRYPVEEFSRVAPR